MRLCKYLELGDNKNRLDDIINNFIEEFKVDLIDINVISNLSSGEILGAMVIYDNQDYSLPIRSKRFNG